jgi:hypothetical protein
MIEVGKMKFSKRTFGALSLLLVICFSFTGCGTQLYEMTAEEENIIVLYSAKIISKYNRAQDKGYCLVAKDKEVTEEDTSTVPEPVADEDGVIQIDEATRYRNTFSSIYGIDGLNFEYQGYEIADTYTTEDVLISDPEEGHSYLIIKVKLTNNTDEDMQVDLLSAPLSYTVLINGSISAECQSTLSMDDLSTYYNKSLGANTTVDTVLLFSVNTGDLANITSLSMQVTRDEQLYNVTLL